MCQFLRVLAISLLILPCLAGAANNNAINNAIADKLAARLAYIQTLQADFRQHLLSTDGEIINETAGSMAIKRPNRFRWSPRLSNGQLLIADSRYLWIYNEDMKQAIRKPIAALKGDNPAALLSGSTRLLRRQFVVDRHQLKKDGSEWFFLHPKGKNTLIKSVALGFRGQALIAMHLVDNLDQISEFSFYHERLNQPIAAQIFMFTPPQDVDVIKEK